MMKNVWIGLVSVTGKPDNQILDGCLGAYVIALSWARNENEFFRTVSIGALKMDLIVKEVLWSEPIEERLRKYNIEDYLISHAKDIKRKGDCKFGIFHAWEEREH